MKPTLFHDIDGVLFGHYGPDQAFQLRPGIGDWLRWTHEHFEVVWLTTWREPEIRHLLTMAWPRNSIYTMLKAPARVLVAHWHSYPCKEAWLLEHVADKGIDWYWIDDQIRPEDINGLDPRRCLSVNPQGESALVDTRAVLESLLTVKKL